MDYKKMTIKELEKIKRDLGNKIRALKEELHEAQIVWNSRQTEIRAREKVAAMSDNERAALAQVLSLEGIATKEGVGEPGL